MLNVSLFREQNLNINCFFKQANMHLIATPLHTCNATC